MCKKLKNNENKESSKIRLNNISKKYLFNFSYISKKCELNNHRENEIFKTLYKNIVKWSSYEINELPKEQGFETIKFENIKIQCDDNFNRQIQKYEKLAVFRITQKARILSLIDKEIIYILATDLNHNYIK